MKKFGKNILAGIFAIFIGCFSSCNLISSDGDSSGSFEFSVSSNLARKVSSKASVLSQDAGSDQSQEKFIIKVDVSGDYQTQVSKEYTMEQWERVMSGLETVTFTIDNIPVSSVIKVKVKVIFALPDWERLILVGESDQITVKEGSNPLNIVLSDAPSDSSGSILIENGVVTITVDKTEVKQNGRISFTSKDSSGSAVTLESFYAQILYKGQDVNNLVTGKSYYGISDNSIKLDASCLLPAGIYQLYISATYKGLSSSQTFEITVKDEFETPETQVALYNTVSGSQYTHSYYLTDSVETASLVTPDYTASGSSKVASIAFDIYGNFYSIGDKKVISSNSKAYGKDLSSQLSSYSNTNGILVDLATNIAYSYGINNTELALFKYPSLISSGNIEDVISYTTISDNQNYNYYPDKVAVYNNKLYVSFKLSNDSGKPYLKVYDISSETTLEEYATFDVKEYATGSEMGLSAVEVNDIFAMEGAAYLLVKESFNGTAANKNIYRRGSVIEYIPPATSGGTGSMRFMALNAGPTISNTAISKMALYYVHSYDGNKTGPFFATQSREGASVTALNPGTGFPNIYSVPETAKYLSSPTKVIGLKPKKLIIADDGCAFYSDSECLKYKNMNRVATIDLERFIVESVQTTAAEFTSSISDYLHSGISLSTLGTVTTSQTTGYYFDSSAHEWGSAGVSESISQLDLAVKPGE